MKLRTVDICFQKSVQIVKTGENTEITNIRKRISMMIIREKGNANPGKYCKFMQNNER